MSFEKIPSKGDLEQTYIIDTKFNEHEYRYIDNLPSLLAIKDTCIPVVLYKGLQQAGGFSDHLNCFLFGNTNINDIWVRMTVGRLDPDTCLDRVTGMHTSTGSPLEEAILDYLDVLEQIFLSLLPAMKHCQFPQQCILIQNIHIKSKTLLSFSVYERMVAP